MAMSDEHRERLRKNRVDLVRNMNIDEELLSHLMTDGIVTTDTKERIESFPTRQRKVGHLLDVIQTRGAKAFPALIQALVGSQQEFLAEMLDPALAQHYKNVEDGGESEVDSAAVPITGKTVAEKVSEIRDNSDIVANVVPVKSADRQSTLSRSDVYRVSGSKRGRAIIINLEYFTRSQLPTRHGNSADVMNLKKLFESLHFTVETCDNKTDKQIYEFLDGERKHEEHNTAEMFVMCVLSHGEDGHFFALNGEKVSLKKIMNYFDGEKCPALRQKPKLFFVQACQGDGKTRGYPKQVSESVGTVSDSAGDHVDATVHPSPSAEDIQSLVHEKADMLIALSTVSGYIAKRHEIYGSQYIRCLVYVFSRKAHIDHVNDMLTEVNDIMSHFTQPGEDVQIAEKTDTLSKKVYFLP